METDAEALGLFWADPYSFTPPQGEPVVDFSTRVLAAVERLQATCAGERVLLISHGGVMRLLLAQARGLPREQLLNVEVGHGAVFSLTVESGLLLKEAI
jgi:alpha-ribazole phosphatase